VTPQEYAAVAAACDEWLRAPDAGLERLAVPLLHVVKETPGWLQQYESALPAKTVSGATAPNLPVRVLLAGARSAARALWRSARQTGAGMLKRESHAQVQVLIVSHLTTPAQLQGEDDAYFGALQRLLHARGVSSVLLLMDHLRDDGSRRAYAAQPQSAQRQLLPRAVPLAAELRIWWRCLRAARRLRREASSCADPLVRALGVLASRDMVRGPTLANLRLHATVARFCAQRKPALVITTHEGDACERVIWHAARTVQHPPLCVGYQHAVLLQHAHAIRRCIGAPLGAADPDVILTLGPMWHAMLAASPQLRGVHLIEYGSHRHIDSAGQRSWLERRGLCLVLPDAQESESVVLFNFAIACAQRCPDLTFVLRPHPIVDFAELARLHSNLRQLPQNVRISSQDLAQECAEARYCLYRGSSAAVQAVRFGARPLYVARPDEMALDPLFSAGEWRVTVHSPEEFVRCVRHAAEAPDLDAAQRARTECARYSRPVRAAAIDELLALAGSTHRGQALDRDRINRFA
jgi:hypothetical protein